MSAADISRIRALTDAVDIDAVLAIEDAAGLTGRFTGLETAAAAVLSRAFAGRAPVYARGKNAPVFTPAVPTAALTAFEANFDIGAQQQRGAWWLPEQVSVKYGLVNAPAYYRDHPTWAMTRADDDSGRYTLGDTAVFATWALLEPFATDLLEPLLLRGPDNGSLDAEAGVARWTAVSDRYHDLGLTSPAVSAALTAMTPGHGWSRLDAAAQTRGKQQLLEALQPAVTGNTVRRWRVLNMRELLTRYQAKSKRGPAESRAVLTKAVQPTLAAWFAGDWLALLDYLGERPADGEVIQTALPTARLYVEGSAKVQQVARERNLDPEKVAEMLASYLGSDAVQSPVQRRIAVIRAWWAALDAAQAIQRPGMPALDALFDSQVPQPGDAADPFAYPGGAAWLTGPVRDDIVEVWGAMVVPAKAGRIVSTLSPYWAMRPALGPALQFWFELLETCWYICEASYARSDLPGLRSHYRASLTAMKESGIPVDDALFVALEAAETRLGPPEPLQDPGEPIDIGHGLSVTFSIGSGSRRAGFEILRDIVTRHRRAWAATHLDAALRAAWETPLRELATAINKAVEAKGKLPTARQLAGMTAPVANSWFGGDLSAALAGIGEQPLAAQIDVRLLPTDRYAYARRVYIGLGGHQVANIRDPSQTDAYRLLSLAANSPRLIQKQELLGAPPSAKDGGFEKYNNWPDGLNYDKLLATATRALADEEVGRTDAVTARAASTVNNAQPATATRSAKASAAQSPQAMRPRPDAVATHPAGWLPDNGNPGASRWWDGQAWTPFTAPGPGAGPAWFTDPESASQLRWYDGRAWTADTHPASPVAPTTMPTAQLTGSTQPAPHAEQARPRPAVVDSRPPWEVPGLPCGLLDSDFVTAATIAATMTPATGSSPHALEPARGPWARYFRAYGTHHEHNQARLRQLFNTPGLGKTAEGWKIYPAILVPDPSPSDTDVVPVGACSQVGYIGSAWSSLSASWAERVRSYLPQQRFVVTRVAVSRENGEYVAEMWLPSLDLPPWLRAEQ